MGYMILGRITWWAIKRIARKKASQTEVQLGAAAVVAAVLVGGVLAARAASGDGD